MPHQPASSALARFRVIDLTQVRAGPTAARQLADWGADVIQVQSAWRRAWRGRGRGRANPRA